METPAVPVAEVPLPYEGLITPVFQAIVRVRDGQATTIGAEALARGPRGSRFARPCAMFAAARTRGVLAHTDRACIGVELAAAVSLPGDLSIFLNVHPDTLLSDAGFPAFLLGTAMRYEIEPARLVLEILEHARLEQARDDRMLDALDILRALGVRIAVDDVAGVVDALRATELRPDVLKLDASLICDARHDAWTRDVLATVAEDAEVSGVDVVAEGIETAFDASLAAEAGITLMQGFRFGHPAAVTSFARCERNPDAHRAVV